MNHNRGLSLTRIQWQLHHTRYSTLSISYFNLNSIAQSWVFTLFVHCVCGLGFSVLSVPRSVCMDESVYVLTVMCQYKWTPSIDSAEQNHVNLSLYRKWTEFDTFYCCCVDASFLFSPVSHSNQFSYVNQNWLVLPISVQCRSQRNAE